MQEIRKVSAERIRELKESHLRQNGKGVDKFHLLDEEAEERKRENRFKIKQVSALVVSAKNKLPA